MIKEQKDVKEFMEGVGQECPTRPISEIDEKLAILRIDLIQEELNELILAMGLIHAGFTIRGLPGLMKCEYEDCEDDLTYDPVGVADALADLLYVVYGCAVTCGIDMEPIWNEVQRSNMSKLKDGYKREDGKWMKGPSYSPPELDPILRDQMD